MLVIFPLLYLLEPLALTNPNADVWLIGSNRSRRRGSKNWYHKKPAMTSILRMPHGMSLQPNDLPESAAVLLVIGFRCAHRSVNIAADVA
jgi:hypothetical protein